MHTYRRLHVSFQAGTDETVAAFLNRSEQALRAAGISPLFHFKVRPLKRHCLLVLRFKEGVHHAVAAGSAIVGRFVDGSRIHISYEGNLHGGLPNEADRYFQAASRMIENYPTVAQGVYDRSQLDIIGTYSLDEDYKDPQLFLFE